MLNQLSKRDQFQLQMLLTYALESRDHIGSDTKQILSKRMVGATDQCIAVNTANLHGAISTLDKIGYNTEIIPHHALDEFYDPTINDNIKTTVLIIRPKPIEELKQDGKPKPGGEDEKWDNYNPA